MFNRERPPLAVLLADDQAAALRRLHSPITGTLRAAPGGKEWCRGCSGLTEVRNCPTLRILDGEPLEAVDVAGAPYLFDEQEA